MTQPDNHQPITSKHRSIPAATDATPPAKAGAPRGNLNACKSGLYGTKLPPNCDEIADSQEQFQKKLLKLYRRHVGEPAIVARTTINTIIRWETVAKLAARWLSLHEAQMTHDQRLAYATRIASASESRDRAIARLGLDISKSDDGDQIIYNAAGQPIASLADLHAMPDANTTQAKSGGP